MKKINIINSNSVSFWWDSNLKTYKDSISAWNTVCIIDSSQIQTVNDGIIKIRNSQHKIQLNDVLYTGKLSNIPRFKLKEYLKENNLRKTSRIEQSTCILLSKKIFEEIVENIKLKKILLINESLSKESIKKHNNDNNYRKVEDDIKRLYHTSYGNIDLESSLNKLKTSPNYYAKLINNSEFIETFIFDKQKTGKTESIIEIIELLNYNPNIKIIFDEDIFADFNKDGIKLDEDYEKILRQMLFSTDQNSVSLAFEMISNLLLDDITTLKLSLLMNEYRMSDRFSKTEFNQLLMKNNNLKTLLNVFKTKKLYWEQDWLTLASGLRMNYKNGVEAEITKQYIINNLNRLLSKVEDINIVDLKFGE
jgi:hypothetical protein